MGLYIQESNIWSEYELLRLHGYHWVMELENLMALSKLAMGGTVEVSDDVAFMVLENWEK